MSGFRRFVRPAELFQTFISLVLILLCLIAANWQYNKGVDRSATNKIIISNLTKSPLDEIALLKIDPTINNLRSGKISGHFDPSHVSLVRDRYQNGVYGFEVLQLFIMNSGNKIWIDRGWVKAGKDARTPPTIPRVSNMPMEINVRVRSENLAPQIAGSFYATIPTKRLASLDKLQGVGAKNYYLDLLPSAAVAPITEISLPELSSGPHLAYAIQWLAFALMIAVGRFLLFRNPK